MPSPSMMLQAPSSPTAVTAAVESARSGAAFVRNGHGDGMRESPLGIDGFPSSVTTDPWVTRMRAAWRVSPARRNLSGPPDVSGDTQPATRR